jgi:hypothetical protein
MEAQNGILGSNGNTDLDWALCPIYSLSIYFVCVRVLLWFSRFYVVCVHNDKMDAFIAFVLFLLFLLIFAFEVSID